MATQYTPILKLALPTQGELSGTWGDTVNDNITSMVEEAIAGRAVINSWTTNSHTLTTADGTTSESRAMMLEFTDTGAALTGAGTVICPAATKVYVCKNSSGRVITVKTSGGTGVAVPNGATTFVFCDGTNVEECVTNIVDVTVSGTITLASGVSVSAILDEDNMASNSATALATQQSIKAYVDSQVGTVDTLAEVLANGNSTGGTDIVVTAGDSITVDTIAETTAANGVVVDGVTLKDGGITVTADVAFGDSDKAVFGAGSDLQIYHDGSNSRIIDSGTGGLYLQGSSFVSLTNSAATETYLYAAENGAVQLKYDNSTKLATTSTGIDVTGTVTADGLTVDSSGTAALFTNGDGLTQLGKIVSDATYGFVLEGKANSNLALKTKANGAGEGTYFLDTANNKRMFIEGTTGDISFYEDTGTTAKFFWDASAESLELGTSSGMTPTASLAINEAVGGTPAIEIIPTTDAISDTTASIRLWGTIYGTANRHSEICNITDGSTASNELAFKTNGSEAMRIDSSGNVGIGTTSPTNGGVLGGKSIHVSSVGEAAGVRVDYTNAATAGYLVTFSGNSTNGLFSTGVKPLTFYTNSAERMRIDSSGNVGIGTSSPASALDVAGTVTADGLTVDGNATVSSTLPYIDFMESDTTDLNARILVQAGTFRVASLNDAKTAAPLRFNINNSTGDISFYEDTGSTAKFYWDASAESLGIGTSSPVAIGGYSSLTMNNTTGTFTEFQEAGTNRLRIGGDNGSAFINGSSGTLRMLTSDLERMRIDSSGNLLVGTTSLPTDDNSFTKFGVSSSGEVRAAVNNGNAAMFKRATTDGDIVEFRKDAAVVGSIGSYSNDFYIGNDDVGLLFNNASNYMTPHNAGTNAPSDGTMDIGASSRRFKDLYLSGGVYLGGTGAANLLDDYETGTWTPTVIGNTTAGTYVITASNCRYTKVGRMVTVTGKMSISVTSGGTGIARFQGLPFISDGNSYGQGNVRLQNTDTTAGLNMTVAGWTANSSDFFISISRDATSATSLLASEINSATIVEIGYTYETAS